MSRYQTYNSDHRFAKDRSEGGGSLNSGAQEYAARCSNSAAASDAFLQRLRGLIEREAKRAKVTPWFAQLCLVNGVDPATRREA